jgi:ORF6N domain
MSKSTLLPVKEVQRRIHLVRGQRVMLDADLAVFYGVTTFNLNKAVNRNRDRFPHDFAFQLTLEETQNLIFQIGISSSSAGYGGVRKPATVFTEQGVAMLASVLRSPRAVAVSVAIIRAFVQLRELLSTHSELAGKLAELERKLEGHDSAIANLFEAIRQLLAPVGPEHDRKIGFHPGNR